MRRVGQGDRAAHPHEARDPPRLGRPFQEWEHQHPPQAVSHPVDPVVAGLPLDEVEDCRDVVERHLVDVPASLAAFNQRRLASPRVDLTDPAQLRTLARAAQVGDEHLVAPRGELLGQMMVGNRPERRVQPQPMAEDDRELGRVGMPGPDVPDAELPPVAGEGEAVRTRAEVGRGCVPPHRGAAGRQAEKDRAENPHEPSPTIAHRVGNPSHRATDPSPAKNRFVRIASGSSLNPRNASHGITHVCTARLQNRPILAGLNHSGKARRSAGASSWIARQAPSKASAPLSSAGGRSSSTPGLRPGRSRRARPTFLTVGIFRERFRSSSRGGCRGSPGRPLVLLEVSQP